MGRWRNNDGRYIYIYNEIKKEQKEKRQFTNPFSSVNSVQFCHEYKSFKNDETDTATGNPGIRESGNPGIRESRNPGIRESGNPGIRESGNPRVRESGNPGGDPHFTPPRDPTGEVMQS